MYTWFDCKVVYEKTMDNGLLKKVPESYLVDAFNIAEAEKRIAEELKAIAIGMGIEGPHTSWWHMFGWNTFGLPLMGPAIATKRFFDTLNRIEQKMNAEAGV